MKEDTFWSLIQGNWQAYFAQPWLIVVFAAIVAIAFVPAARRALRAIGYSLVRAGRPAWRGALVVFLFAMVWGVFPSLIGLKVEPIVHDEISYMLAADTFLHGRLSNPTPICWENFQTFHELMVPTYASKFPPGQGLALAAGTLLGSPRIGAFGMVALASAVVYWMIRAVASSRWAIAGGLLAAVHPTTNEWSQSFWGGGVAMFGAAVLCGAALRVAPLLVPAPRRSRFHASARHKPPIPIAWGIVMGVGIAIMLISRPFEGTILTFLVGTWLLVRAILARVTKTLLLRATLPAAVTLAPSIAWIGYFNYRVTGDPLVMPYAEHARQYMTAPIFWWQEARPEHRSGIDRIDWFHRTFEFHEWEMQGTAYGFWVAIFRKLLFVTRDAAATAAVGVVLLTGGVLAFKRGRRAVRLVVACCALLLAIHMCITPWLRMQYLSVLAPAFFLVLAMAVRELRTLVPPRFANALVMSTLLGLLVVQGAFDLRRLWLVTAEPNSSPVVRQKIIDSCLAEGGKHIIFVAYQSGMQRLFDWVYNSADIDAQPVIFARFLEHEKNKKLFQSYPGRSVWLLTIGYESYRIEEKIHVDPKHPELPPRVISD